MKILFITLLLASAISFAEETTTPTNTTDPNSVTTPAPKPELTEQKISELKTQGWKDAQIDKLKALVDASGKTPDEIIAMRKDLKMGWGKIAKELGVHPGVLGRGHGKDKGHSNREDKEARKEARKERKEKREMNRAEKHENKSHGNGGNKH